MATLRPVTLITGASSGIGAALARLFAEGGHELILTARREEQLAATAAAIAARGKKRPLTVPIDLSRLDSCARLSAELGSRGLEPEIVVNNAGFGLVGRAAELDRAEQLTMIDLNIRALTDLSLRYIDSVTRHRGGILNVASLASFLPGPGMAVYHATKAYVLSFSEALHQELAGTGARVTVLCPGPVPTAFQERAGMPERFFPRFLSRSAERVAREGYEGFMRGERVVIPGLVNRMVPQLTRFLSRSAALRLSDRRRKGRAQPEPARWPRRS